MRLCFSMRSTEKRDRRRRVCHLFFSFLPSSPSPADCSQSFSSRHSHKALSYTPHVHTHRLLASIPNPAWWRLQNKKGNPSWVSSFVFFVFFVSFSSSPHCSQCMTLPLFLSLPVLKLTPRARRVLSWHLASPSSQRKGASRRHDKKGLACGFSSLTSTKSSPLSLSSPLLQVLLQPNT